MNGTKKEIYARIPIELFNRIPELLEFTKAPSVSKLIEAMLEDYLAEITSKTNVNENNGKGQETVT